MLFASKESLEEIITRLLMYRPGLSAQQIELGTRRYGRPFSKAAVYKELKKLVDDGILVKVKGDYRLSLSWSLRLLSLTETLERNYLKCLADDEILPATGEKQAWQFTNLLRTNDFSSYSVLHLISRASDKTVYSWNPHPWFYLAQTSQEAAYVEGLKLAGGHFWKVIGGDSPLDRWTGKFWRGSHTNAAFAPNFESNRRLYYNVVGNYISSFTVEAPAAQAIDRLYRETKEISTLSAAKILALFRRPYRCHFVIEHNPRKALRLKRRFARYFGIDKSM